MNAALGVFDVMLAAFGRRLAALLPLISALVLLGFANLPLSFSGGVLPAPLLALAAVYFWALMRPDLMPPPVVLALGLLEDLLSGGPPGLWASGFLAAYLLIDRQRETLASLTGIGTVIGFAGAMFMAAATAFVLAAIVYLRWPPIAPLLVEAVSTVILYPLVAIPLGWMSRRLVGARRRD